MLKDGIFRLRGGRDEQLSVAADGKRVSNQRRRIACASDTILSNVGASRTKNGCTGRDSLSFVAATNTQGV